MHAHEIWQELGIPPTRDPAAIKQAYAARWAFIYRSPDAGDFERLRTAMREAMAGTRPHDPPMAQLIAEGLELRLHPWPPAGLEPIDPATVSAPLAGEPPAPAPEHAMTARLTDDMVVALDAIERALQSDDEAAALDALERALAAVDPGRTDLRDRLEAEMAWQLDRLDPPAYRVTRALAERLGWSCDRFRLAYVILSIFSAAFPGILVYLVLWLVNGKVNRNELMPNLIMLRFVCRTG